MDKNMKISVITTVRNEKASIKPFLNSLISQKRKPDEIIVVDGHSTDGTEKILEQYEYLGKIKLISSDCNIAEGRNLAISRAQNNIIAVTDAGCIVDKNWLKEIEQCYLADEKVDVVAGNFKPDCHTPFEEAVYFSSFSPDREETDHGKYFPSSRSVSFKKKAWETAGGYPEWLYAAEDTLFNIRLRQVCMKFVFCKKAIVFWRPRQGLKSLIKQRYNYARGNGRVGIAYNGYIVSLKNHIEIFFVLMAGAVFNPLLIVALFFIIKYFTNVLKKQTIFALEKSRNWSIAFRVPFILELIRIVGLAGFLRGNIDRFLKPEMVKKQMAWMDRESVKNLKFK